MKCTKFQIVNLSKTNTTWLTNIKILSYEKTTSVFFSLIQKKTKHKKKKLTRTNHLIAKNTWSITSSWV